MDRMSLLQLIIPLALLLGMAAVVKALATFKGTLPVSVRAVPLMTRAERQTLTYIEMSIPWARVHAQVSMGALLAPRRGLSRSQSASIRNRFSSKRVDYVVEERSTGRIVMLIELDDRYHNTKADAQRDRMTAAAGYSTLRLPADEKPTLASVRRHIARVFEAHPDLRSEESNGFR